MLAFQALGASLL